MNTNWKIPLSFVISLNHFSSVLLKSGLYCFKSKLIWKLVDSVLVSTVFGTGLNYYFSVCNLFIWEVKCQVHPGWNKLLFINMQTNANVCRQVQKDQTRDKKYLNSNCPALPRGPFNRWKEMMMVKLNSSECDFDRFHRRHQVKGISYPPDHYGHQHYKTEGEK